MGGKRLFIGGLSRDARSSDLDKLFGRYGDIRDVRVMNGFGFVEFYDDRDAYDAMKRYDDTEFLGTRIAVEYAKGRRDRSRSRSRDRRRYWRSRYSRSRSRTRRFERPRSSRYRVKVSNLPPACTWQDLKDYFRDEKVQPTYTVVLDEREGLGSVHFATQDDLDFALDKMEMRELKGYVPKLEIDDSGFNSGDHGRRSRSRSPRTRRSRSRTPVRDMSPSPRRGRSPSPRDNVNGN